MFLVFSLCSCFRLIDLGSISGKVTDYALVYIFCILIYSYRKIKLKNDKIGWIVIILTLYCTLHLICTIIFTSEEPLLAFQAYRNRLIMLMYFVIKQLNTKELFCVLKYTFGIVIVSTFLYILQPLGIQLYQGGQDETNFAGEMVRYRNAPNYLHFFIIFLLFSQFVIARYKKYIYIIILLCGLILPMSRTSIITLGVVIFTNLLFKRKVKAFVSLLFVCGIAYALLGSYLEYRMESTDTTGDILSVLSMNSYEDFDNSGGTFQFRIAMLLERLDYLVQTNNLLLGIGFPHELSAYTRSHFHFLLGTIVIINNETMKGYIETPDISWVSLLMRLGLIGFVLYCCLLWTMGKVFLKSKDSIGICAFLWMSYLVLTSFSGDVIGMSAFNNYCLMFILYNYVVRKSETIKAISENSFIDKPIVK